MTSNVMLEAALFYARQGWDVFPIQPKNKTPFKDFHWNQEASHDTEKIKDWWAEWPGANVAIATGKRSGVFVVDIDASHGGEQSWAELILENGAIDDTPIAATGGGGRHIFFKYPGQEVRNTAGKLGEGIDTRGDGGYVVAAPSIHPNGKAYAWTTKPSKTPLATMPPWLMGMLLQSETTTAADAKPMEAGAPIPRGQRNSFLTSIAGALRKRGATTDSILTTLMVENASRCTPPLPDTELEKIAASVGRYPVELQEKTIVQGRKDDLEWTWAASVYSSPQVALTECAWLDPYLLSDHKISTFWELLKDGVEVVQAATDAGALADLISMQMRAQPEQIQALAAQIARYSYAEKVTWRIADLQREIANGSIERVRKIISEMAGIEPFSERDPSTAQDAAKEFVGHLRNISGRSIKTFISPLDNATGGLERQTLTTLAARPSMGKSTLAWQIALNVANSGNRALFFSLEMSKVQLIAKTVCGNLGYRWRDVRDGKLLPDQLDRVAQEAGRFGERYKERLMIEDRPTSSTQMYDMVSRFRPDLVVIDHLRLVKDENISEVRRLGEITQRAKELAKKFNLHVLMIAQLNRETEHRDNKKPQLSDLRDSGEIEENSDNVLMMYRADYYQDIPDAVSETEILIRKFRDDCRSQNVNLKFDMASQWFS